MFGYVNINKDTLSKEGLATYQSFYCGLCQVLRKKYGVKGQMLLNYDMTFLILLLSGLYELDIVEDEVLCPLHPTKKRPVRINEATYYAADMDILLSWQNFADDWRDEKSVSKSAMMKMYAKAYKQVKAQYPDQARAVEGTIAKLHKAEENYESNVDLVAGCSGEMLAEIFDWKHDVWTDTLHSLGFYLGKFVYLMDAYEDMEKDRKKGNYNVLSLIRREKPEGFDEFCRILLVSMMSECAKAFERLPVLLYADIIRNILYSGIWTRFQLVQARKNKKSQGKAGKKHRKPLPLPGGRNKESL